MNTETATVEEVSRLIAAYNFRRAGRIGKLEEHYVDEASDLAKFLVMSGLGWGDA